MATMIGWRLKSFDDNTKPEINESNYTTFDLGSWGTYGESVKLEIDLEESGYNSSTNYQAGIKPFGNNTDTDVLNNTWNGNLGIPTSEIEYNFRLGSPTLVGEVATFKIEFELTADIDNFLISSPNLSENNILKNNLNNSVINDNNFISVYNSLKYLVLQLETDNTNTLQHFYIPFACKFLNQNFAGAQPDINFISYQLFVNGNIVPQPSSKDNTIVKATFQSTTPLNKTVLKIFNFSQTSNSQLNQSNSTFQSLVSLGNDLYQGTWIITGGELIQFNQYRFIFIAYDTPNDKFNSFPLDFGPRGISPSPSTKFRHNWAIPTDVTTGLDNCNIENVTVGERIGSNLSIDRDIYSSAGINDIADYFTDYRILDKDGNILTSYSIGQQVPLDAITKQEVGKLNFSYVYRVPEEWENTTNVFNWELFFNFPFDIEKWTFKAGISVLESNNNIVFKDEAGGEIINLCSNDLPDFIQVENTSSQTAGDVNYAVVFNNFGWREAQDECSENIQQNSIPNEPYNWGLFEFDNPYIFDVEASNGVVLRYKFRLSEFVENFGINSISGVNFGSIKIQDDNS